MGLSKLARARPLIRSEILASGSLTVGRLGLSICKVAVFTAFLHRVVGEAWRE